VALVDVGAEGAINGLGFKKIGGERQSYRQSSIVLK